MKKLLIIVCITALFTNCNNTAGSGGWSSQDRQKGIKKCMEGAPQLDEATAKKLCNCALEKTMRKYRSYDEADEKVSDEEGSEIVQGCWKTIQGGGGDEPGDDNKGKGGGLFGGGDSEGDWSNSDEQKFMNTCLQNAMNAGSDRQTSTAHCQCTLKKIQKKYSSYAEADQKMTREQVNAIEQECNAGNNNDDYDDGGNDDN